jgi:hypothetical protein
MRLHELPCRNFRSCRVLGLAVLGLALMGCAKSLHEATGKLVYADTGEPVAELAGFDVIFTNEKIGKSARGMIQKDGTFKLGTLVDDDGVPLGEFVVTLTQPVRMPDRPYQGDPVVDRSYEDPAKSDLKATVEEGKNSFTFRLKRLVKRKS